MGCPGCGRPFGSVLGLDAHRRHPATPAGCRYRPGERRGAWRPGYLSRPALVIGPRDPRGVAA